MKVLTMFAMIFSIVFSFIVGSFANATASSTVVTKSTRILDHGQKVYVYKVAWTASSVDGSVVDSTLSGVHGFLMKAITNPGATAPTDNYDITIADTDDATLDAANSLLLNRDTATTEVVFPVGATGATALWFQPGTYTLSIANNSVNSALGVIWLYFVDPSSNKF